MIDLQHALPCCAGGGGSRTPCGRSTAAPSQGCSACGVCLARVHRVCSAAVFWGCSGTLGVSFEMQTVLRGIRGANFNALRAILEPLGTHLGGSGGGSGGSWGALWGVRGRLGPFLAALEPIFAVLARPRASLGRSWVALGRSWAALGCSWAALGPLLGRSCRSWVTLGPLWGALGLPLGVSWPLLGDPNRPKIDPSPLLNLHFLQKRDF